jgi:hypothetical protein
VAKGIWEEQLIENQLKFRRQLKIRIWTVLTMLLFDFVAMFFMSALFVQDVVDGALWQQALWFTLAFVAFFWFRREAARLLVLSASFRALTRGSA